MNSSPPVVGIDLGTTFSLAAYMKDGQPIVVRDAAGVALVPSCISFHDDGSVLVGSEARKRALSDPDHTIFSVKRLMGRTLADLEKELPLIPHQVVEREVGGGRKVLHVVIGGCERTPAEKSAMILKKNRQRGRDPPPTRITPPPRIYADHRHAPPAAGPLPAAADV